MVQITILGRVTVESQPRIAFYEDNSNTLAVKDDLVRAYGAGNLQTKDGVGVLGGTLIGDYDFHISAGYANLQPVFTLQLKVPFPPVILRKSSSSARGSIHGSTIVTGGDEDEKETMRIWFTQTLARTILFELDKSEPDERQASSSRMFKDYKAVIEGLEFGLKVWDFQITTGGTISIVLEDTVGLQKELSGRADFIISSSNARCHGAALQHALCVVVIQSNGSEQTCEFQLLTYLVLMMNRFGLERLAGILVYNDGRCRAFRASRDNIGFIYEQNDTFLLYQIADILPTLLKF